ncbi:hypothetical protein J437_LFUL007678 [Ladona fulva]|uniref:PiggyBac transposable element-derived protein domain-containing protein n=1 Tax=Ladona fulva TaxID=123851 RepID=A0A8K0KBT0_LADFU|nr:hypothetical protein J437_LFUL007678 [Ladona fulva]
MKIFLLVNLSFRIMVVMVLSNFFRGKPIRFELTRRGFGATGTVRENRVKEMYNLPVKIQFKRLKNGNTVYRSDGPLLIMLWNHSNVVAAMTNYFNHQMKAAARYCIMEKKKIFCSNSKSNCRIQFPHGGKPISVVRNGEFTYFRWALDISVSQGWLLSQRLGNNVTWLQFGRECGCYILKHYGTAAIRRIQPSTSSTADDIRTDRLVHFIDRGEKKSKVCVVYKGRTIYICRKFKVSLHPDCFISFHE